MERVTGLLPRGFGYDWAGQRMLALRRGAGRGDHAALAAEPRDVRERFDEELKALTDGGVKMGIPRALSSKLATQTVLGSAKLLLETNEHPGRLKDMVTSPGGTSAAALHELESGRLRTVLSEAVWAAYRRTEELGRNLEAETEAGRS